MKHTSLPFSTIGGFSDIFLDFLNQKDTLQPFYGLHPSLENFEQQVKKKFFQPAQREVLHRVLQEQYSAIDKPPKAVIDSLLEEKTFTVTTGHQLNIFSGPLYFIYKIVSTINLARRLKTEFPNYNFVPVYWMATEDHDFEEICHFNLFGKDYTWNVDNAHGPVGRMACAGLERLLEEMGEVPSFFQKAYTEHDNLADATRYFVHELFGQEGLLVIDADHASLKQQFKEVMLDDLLHHQAHAQVASANATFQKMGYKTQVFPRPINLFYMDDESRQRIERDGESYRVLNSAQSFSKETLLAEVEAHPEKFSPNVVLRPLYQEVVLPNIAYLGGPSEVAYWLQLKGVFDHYRVPFPIVMPRNFALVIPRAIGKKIQKLALDYTSLFQEEQAIVTQFIKANTEINLMLDDEKGAVEKVFDGIVAKAKSVDQSLEGYLKGEAKKVAKQLENIERRLKKAEEKNQEVSVKQISAIKAKLFPKNGMQERVENFLNFYINNPQFIKQLLDSFEPLDFSYNIIEYES